LFGGLGEFPHTLFLYETFALVANEIGRISGEIGRGQAGWLPMGRQIYST
jgi:hypothetical protein